MSTPPNTVVVNEDLTKAVTGAMDNESIRAAVLAEAEKQLAVAVANQTATDAATAEAARVAAAKDAANAGAKFSRTEIIGGKEFTFEAETELELERSVSNAFKVAYAIQPETSAATVVDPAIEAERVTKAAEAEQAAKAELELKFKRGEISTAEYLEQSGAVDQYLEKKGVSIEKLKTTISKSEAAQEQQSWSEAAEAFKNGPAGADWPGGNANLAIIGRVIAADPKLADATDKVAALAQAYNIMKSEGIVIPYQPAAAAAQPTEAEKAAAAAKTAPVVPVTPAAPVVPVVRTAATSSSIFGASSGAGASTEIAKPATPAQAEAKNIIPKDASPAEIMDAWKAEQLRNGLDPNAAFMQTFSSRRS